MVSKRLDVCYDPEAVVAAGGSPLRVAVTGLPAAFDGQEYLLPGVKDLNGDQVFVKAVDLGTLPNTTIKDVAHGIVGLNKLSNLIGMADNPAVPIQLNLLFLGSFSVNDTNVRVTTTADQTASTGHVILWYSKT